MEVISVFGKDSTPAPTARQQVSASLGPSPRRHFRAYAPAPSPASAPSPQTLALSPHRRRRAVAPSKRPGPVCPYDSPRRLTQAPAIRDPSWPAILFPTRARPSPRTTQTAQRVVRASAPTIWPPPPESPGSPPCLPRSLPYSVPYSTCFSDALAQTLPDRATPVLFPASRAFPFSPRARVGAPRPAPQVKRRMREPGLSAP